MQPWDGATSQKGDLNHDGIITPADAAIALQLAACGGCAAGASADPRSTSPAAGMTSVPMVQTTQASALGMSVTDGTCKVVLDARYGDAKAQEAVVTFTLTNTGDQPITVYSPALPSPVEGITLTALGNYPITIPPTSRRLSRSICTLQEMSRKEHTTQPRILVTALPPSRSTFAA